MAISTEQLGKLVIEIVANTEDAEEALAKIKSKIEQTSEAGQSSLHQFMTATSQVGVGFTSLGRLATRLGSTITTNVTTPLIGLGTAAAKTAVDFLELRESAMVGFEILLDGKEAASDYMNALLELAKKTPYAQEAFYDSAKSLLAMGFEAEEAMVALQAMTDAAAASGRGTEGIDTLTRALGKMKASGKVTLEALNMMTDMGVPAVEILANQLGVTTQEFFAMTKAGEVLAEDALPLLIEGIEEGTDGLNGMTAKLGGLAEALKDGTLTGAIDSLHTAWRTFSLAVFNLDENDYESENKNKIITLLGKIGDILKHLPALFQSVTDSTGPFLDRLIELADEFDKFLTTTDPEELRKIGDIIINIAKTGPALLVLGGALKMIGSGFRAMSGVAKIMEGAGVAKGVFGTLKTGIVDVGLKISTLSKSFLNFVNPINLVRNASTFLATKMNVLGSAITFCGGGVKGFLNLLKANFLGAIGSAASGVGGFVSALAPVVAVILLITSVVIALKAHWEDIVKIFQGFATNIHLEDKFKAIEEALTKLVTAVGGEVGEGGVFELLKQILQKVGEVILLTLTPAFALLGGLFDAIVSAVAGVINIITGFVSIISGVVNLIVAIFTGDGEKIKEAWSMIWEGVILVVSGLWGAVSGFFSGLVEGIIAFFTSLWDTLVGHSIVPDTVNAIAEWFGKLPGMILGGIASFVSSIIQNFITMASGIISNVSSLPSKVLSLFQNMGSQVKNYIGGLASSAWGWGYDMVQGIANGIRGAIGSVVNAASNIASTIRSYLHFSRPDVGPLREYEEWMPDFVQGMTEGLQKSTPKLLGAVSTLSQQMSNTMGIGDLTATGSFTQQAVISDGANTAQKLQRMIDLMEQFFPEALTGMNQSLVLDTGVLVAQTAPAFDTELGKISIRKGRGR